MAFTYTPGSADATIVARNKIRRLIGDISSGAGPHRDGTNVTDEEILEVTTDVGLTLGSSLTERDTFKIAAKILRGLATEWAAVPNYTLGPHSEQAGDVAARLEARAVTLEAQAARGSFYAGGISQDRMRDVESDTDRVAPAFTRDMDRHP